MDKKVKKKIEMLHKKRSHLQQQLAGATRQTDDPGEVETIRAEIAEVQSQIEKMKEK
ncbi:MAG: hypothetical protein JW829_07390 [Pirellulales bacterium]|nr:hypothetical protein [Pirellulales bacterium]